MVGLLYDEVSKAKINFLKSCATWLKDGICAVANTDVEFLMHIQMHVLPHKEKVPV